VCCNSFLQIPPEIFYRVLSRWLWWPLENLGGFLLKPSLGGIWGKLVIIVLLEGPMMPKIQLPHWWDDFFSQDFLIFQVIYPAFHTLQISSAIGCKAAAEHHKAPPCLTVGRISFLLLPPDILWSVVVYVWDFWHAFSMCLNVQAETSVPVATKSCCSSFAVTQGFFWSCLLRNLVAATDSFLFLHRSGIIPLFL